MSHEVDHFEPDRLTDMQRALIDAFMEHGDRVKAFNEAGYTCSNKARLYQRVSRAFSAPLVHDEIERRKADMLAQRMLEKRITPLDVMLENMEHWIGEARSTMQTDAATSNAARSMAQKAAADAAPYVHPRLQTIAVSRRVNLRDMSEEELDAFLADIEQQIAEDQRGGASGTRGSQVIEGTASRES